MISDDEAFIRTIVDRPGDDLPRLVYADWLDERGDPRGAYLRAETEWAKPWRDGQRPGDDAAVRAMAMEMDPVWVARVSRPPLGVCCQHVSFQPTDPRLTLDELVQIESRLGGTFPAPFRGFLLNHNGCVPDPPFLPYPAHYGWDDMDLEIGKFFTASRVTQPLPADPSGSWLHELEWERSFLNTLYVEGGGQGPNPLIADMVPVAHTLHDLGYFLIGTKSGTVYHFSDYCHWSDDPNHLAEYALTFPDFLIRLRPELGG